MNPSIAPATEADYPEIADLWYRSWLSTGAEHGEGITVQVLTQRLRDEPWDIWAARCDSSIAAFLALDRADACLSQLFVAPDFQNRGIGLRLFHLAQQELPDGFWLRTDETNVGARRFYDRQGLQLERIEAGRAYYRWRP